VPTEVSWNISTDFRELCTRVLKEAFNERNVALCQFSLTLATLNYEPVNILDIPVQPRGAENTQSCGAYSCIQSLILLLKIDLLCLKMKGEIVPYFLIFPQCSPLVSYCQTLSFPRYVQNHFKQASDSSRELPGRHNKACPCPTELYGQGQRWHSCLLCSTLTRALLSAQPSYLTCKHVLFINKVSINIPDKKTGLQIKIQ